MGKRLGNIPHAEPLSFATETGKQVKSIEKGVSEGWTRATFIVRKQYLAKLKDLAWWDRRQIKELVDEALEKYLKDKVVRPLP